MVEVFKGKYQIVREIARSNDIVYEAIDTSLNRRIALKELNLTAGLTGQARRERIERFQREARSAGRLSHPNIVSIYDFGEDEGRYFIAMEYLEGQSLRDRLSTQGALSLKEGVDVASQLLDAIYYAHQHQVVHRDIKPDNVHLLPGNKVKLTDFGIARLTEEPSLTSNGQIFGTPSYMSPEQIEGRNIDHRSDIFSMGVLLYEILTGRKPFVGDSVIGITYAIMNQPVPPMPGVPYGIEQVVHRALAKSPLERTYSAEQMKLDLRNASDVPSMFLGGGSTGYQQQPMGNSTGMFNTPPQNYPVPPQVPSMSPATQNLYYSQNQSVSSGGGVVFQPLPAPMAPQPQPLDAQPWSWSGQQPPPTQLQSPPQAQMTPQQIQQLLQANGIPLYVRPHRDPITLSDSSKRFMTALFVAIVVGLGLGALAFMKSFEKYQTSIGSQIVVEMMTKGKAAYDNKDYGKARGYFEEAKSADKERTKRESLDYSLSATYIQLGHIALESQNWKEAQTLYEKALTMAPESLVEIARKGRAQALDKQGLKEEAKTERSLLSGKDSSAPDKLPTASPMTAPLSSDQVYERYRAEARQLIAEGDALFDKGSVDGARDKWMEASGKAAGDTPEHRDAKDRLDRTSTEARF